jgi:y4mF family transcriptional regulator
MPIYASLIGQLVRKRRKDLHLNQQDLAELAQVTIKTIYAIESNTGNPTIEILERILHVLGLEMKFQIKSIEA